MRRAKKFVINAAILTLTSFILRTINLYFSAYISNKIGAEGMGVFQLILSTYIFFVTLATSGIGLTTTRLVSEELALNSQGGAKAAVVRCLYHSVFFSLISALIIFMNAEFIAKNWIHNKISASPIYALSISLPFLAMSAVLSGYFTAVRRIIKSASAQIFEQFIKIIFTVYLVNLMAPKGLNYACLALVVGGAVSEFLSFLYLFVLYLFDKRMYKASTKVDNNLTKRMLKISLPVAFSSYIRSALATYKQIITPIGLEKSGVKCDLAISQYGIIRGMVMPVLMFPASFLIAFSSLLIPEITEKSVQKRKGDIRNIISRIFKITLLFSICISGILFGYSSQLSQMIYKNQDAAAFIKILSPLILVMYLDDIVDAILKGLNEQVSVVWINIFDTIVSIGLLYTFLPWFGIRGYIIVIFLSEIFNGYLSIKRLIKVTYFRIDFIKWIIIPTFAVAISIFVVKIFLSFGLFLSILFVMIIYFIILYTSGIVTRRDFIL